MIGQSSRFESGRAMGALAAIGSGFAYGVYPILAKHAIAQSISSATILLLRFSGCIVIMWAYVLITRKPWRLPVRKALGLAALGACAYALMSALNLNAIRRISASLASLILCSYPVFVTFFMLLFRREKLTFHKVVSLAACVAGLSLLLNVSNAEYDFIGILLALGASLSYTVYIVMGSFLNKGIEPIVAGSYIMTGVVMVYLVSGLASGDLSFQMTPSGWGIMLMMSAGCTALPVMLFWIAVRKIGAVKASVIGSIEPLTTVLLELLLFKEYLNVQQDIGAIILIVGIIFIQMK